MNDNIVAYVFTKKKWHVHGVYPEYVIIGKFLVVGMVTVSLSTACWLHSQTSVPGGGLLSVTIIYVTPVSYFQ